MIDSKALEVLNLSKSYGTLRAVNDVSFEVRGGEIFGLLGPNGAGKTSIISTIVTLEKADSGSVRVFGHDVRSDSRMAKSKTGWVPQEVINHGYFSVEEILQFHAGYYGKKLLSQDLDRLLERVDLKPHRLKKVKQLSGGMKRRLMIAKALCHGPKLLLLDEPTAGVDIDLRRSLWEFVKDLQKEGVAILLTTHYLEEAEELCDRVAFLSKGKIIRSGQTREIVRDLTQKTVMVDLSSSVPSVSHPFVISQNQNTIVLQTPMSISVFEGLQQAGIPLDRIKDIRITEGDLEDAFRKVMGAHL